MQSVGYFFALPIGRSLDSHPERRLFPCLTKQQYAITILLLWRIANIRRIAMQSVGYSFALPNSRRIAMHLALVYFFALRNMHICTFACGLGNHWFSRLFVLTWINLNAAWMNNRTHYKAWADITYLSPTSTVGPFEVWEWSSNFIPHFNPSMKK